MEKIYTLVDSIGDAIISWTDPNMKFSGYTKVSSDPSDAQNQLDDF